MLLGPGENSLAKSIAAYSGIPDVNLLQVSMISDYVVFLDKIIYSHSASLRAGI